MANPIDPGDTCIVAHTIVVNNLVAFKKGERVIVESVNPSPGRPEYKYVVLSVGMNKRFQLSDSDIVVNKEVAILGESRERITKSTREKLTLPGLAADTNLEKGSAGCYESRANKLIEGNPAAILILCGALLTSCAAFIPWFIMYKGRPKFVSSTIALSATLGCLMLVCGLGVTRTWFKDITQKRPFPFGWLAVTFSSFAILASMYYWFGNFSSVLQCSRHFYHRFFGLYFFFAGSIIVLVGSILSILRGPLKQDKKVSKKGKSIKRLRFGSSAFSITAICLALALVAIQYLVIYGIPETEAGAFSRLLFGGVFGIIGLLTLSCSICSIILSSVELNSHEVALNDNLVTIRNFIFGIASLVIIFALLDILNTPRM